MHEQLSTSSQFIGRFHVLLVHLPIGFIMLLAALEALALLPRFKGLGPANRVILGLTVPAVICTAATGWLLARAGDYEAALLVWHRWTGVAVALCVLVLFLIERAGWQRTYRAGLGFTLLLVALTGHLGGSLTHGRNYLIEFAPSWLGGRRSTADDAPAIAGKNLMSEPVFNAAVQPIFNRYCVSCHGPSKQKAKLRLDSYDALVAGSENGPIMEPGDASASLITKRLQLPPEDEDHMPPEGKRQPSPEEIAFLQWWINAGAPTNQPASSLNPPDTIARFLGAGTANPR
jgi:hypothetical protein